MKKAFLVYVYDKNNLLENLEEVIFLLTSSYKEIVEIYKVNQEEIDPTYCLGKGKLEKIKELVNNTAAAEIVFSLNLTPRQMATLNNYFNLPVEDRGGVILSIFNNIAQTRQAKLQVRIAQLSRQLPLLANAQAGLDQQTGSSGGVKSRGKGEKNIEIQRRRLNEQIQKYKKELESIYLKKTHLTKRREKNRIPIVTLVGYSNVGKSTLMNQILSLVSTEEKKKVLADDRFFSSLETTSRKIPLGYGLDIILSDTVGLINDLPNDLLPVFFSTFYEINNASLLLLVFDCSSQYFYKQLALVNSYIKVVGGEEINKIIVLSKADRLSSEQLEQFKEEIEQLDFPYQIVFVSREDPASIAGLVAEIRKEMSRFYQQVTLFIEYKDVKMYEYIAKKYVVYRKVDKEDGILLNIDISEEDYDLVAPYIINQ